MATDELTNAKLEQMARDVARTICKCILCSGETWPAHVVPCERLAIAEKILPALYKAKQPDGD